MNKIAPAFIAAKKAFLPAKKDTNNPFFKSKYADLSSCFDAVDEAMLNNGIAIYQETFQDEIGVTVETVFLHESGESIRGGKLHVPASKQDPQGYGSALTYARRYSLMTACGIAPEDDDGNSACPPEKTKAKSDTPPPGSVTENYTAWDDLEDDFFKDITDIPALTAKMNAIPAADRGKYVGAFNNKMGELKGQK